MMKSSIKKERTLTTLEVKKLINREFKDLPIKVDKVEWGEHCAYKGDDCYELSFIAEVPLKRVDGTTIPMNKSFILQPLPLCRNRGELFSWLEGLFHEAYEDFEPENCGDEELSILFDRARELCEELDGRYNRDFIPSPTSEQRGLIGKTIRIISMTGEPQYAGKTGRVTEIDDAGQIHGTWGGCALCENYGDKWEVLD